MKCNLCPRNCGADRKLNNGFCSAPDGIKVARASLHFYEEPPISGEKGSGTVFFSGCSLLCAYCQNRAISRGEAGAIISIERLSDIYFELKEKGAHNINLVTPTHYIDKIAESIRLAKKRGFDLPFIYNTSAYDKVEELKKLNGLIDIYLPDFKYIDEALAEKYSMAKDYPEVAKKAIEEMYSQVGSPKFDQDGMMKKGVIIRHLMLPFAIENSFDAVKYLFNTYGNRVYYSIMSQYTPIKENNKFGELLEKLDFEEYEKLIDFCVDLGMENAFIQEEESVGESFIPEFDLEGVLP